MIINNNDSHVPEVQYGTCKQSEKLPLVTSIVSLPRFQFYKAPAMTVKSERTMSVKDVYLHITQDIEVMNRTHEYRELLKKVRDGKADEKAARQFKASHFDFACFSGTFSYRKDDCLVEHSGLLCLDFDHVGSHVELWALRERLLSDKNFTTWLLFTSPSGDGLKWVIGIDLTKCDHKTWFRALQNYVRATYQMEVDEKCVNVSRACFLPHDSQCFVNESIFLNSDVIPY